MRIVFLGDSLTAGKIGTNYVDKVAQALPHVECINAGVGGDTAFNLFRRIAKDVAPRKPDGVVVMVGINDAIMASQGAVWRWYYRTFKGVPCDLDDGARFSRYYRQTLESLLRLGARAWAVLEPVEANPALAAALRRLNAEAARIAAEMRAPALDLMAAVAPPVTPGRRLLSPWARMADAVRLGVLDEDHNRAGTGRGYTYTFDGVHLTERGAACIAREMVAFLRAQGI